MSKKSNQKNKKQAAEQLPLNTPWISMKAGIIVISIVSIAMAVMTAWQAVPIKGLGEGILYGVFFGGLIWVIFLGFILFRRLVH